MNDCNHGLIFPSTGIPYAQGKLDRSIPCRRQAETYLYNPESRVLMFWEGKPLVDLQKERLVFWPLSDDLRQRDPVFLGASALGPVFAVSIFLEEEERGRGCKFQDLREASAFLPATESSIAAQGRALLEWHRIHPCCSTCGTRTVMTDSGSRRECPKCKAQHFPRIDPVVIMRIEFQKSLLLAARPGKNIWSLIAGFVEPGETFEQAVYRETQEETGLEVTEIRYLASQPWPFPSSLMIGCHARALGNKILLDSQELASAGWFSRQDLQKMLTSPDASKQLPPSDSLARVLIDSWLREEEQSLSSLFR